MDSDIRQLAVARVAGVNQHASLPSACTCGTAKMVWLCGVHFHRDTRYLGGCRYLAAKHTNHSIGDVDQRGQTTCLGKSHNIQGPSGTKQLPLQVLSRLTSAALIVLELYTPWQRACLTPAEERATPLSAFAVIPCLRTDLPWAALMSVDRGTSSVSKSFHTLDAFFRTFCPTSVPSHSISLHKAMRSRQHPPPS